MVNSNIDTELSPMKFKLGEVCRTTSGGTPSRKVAAYYMGTIPWVKSGELEDDYILDTEEKITEEALKNSSAKVFPKGTLLIALYGATIGKMAFLGIEAATNQAICGIFENDRVVSKYLYFFLLSKRSFLIDQGVGGAQPNISQTILKNLEIPLPNIENQKSIVSKIDILFSELDKGIERLKLAQQQLKLYRQAVLKWAFEGRLTNEHVKEGELPEGWVIKSLNELGSWTGGGTPSKTNRKFWTNGNIMWVSPKDMKFKTIDDTEDKITQDAVLNSSAKLISKGSILFVVRSGILRRTLPVALTSSDVTVNQDIKAFTPVEVLPTFIYWYAVAKNEDIRRECTKDGTTVESIELGLLKNYSIPICPHDESMRIVQIIESKIENIDSINLTINNELNKAISLKENILNKLLK